MGATKKTEDAVKKAEELHKKIYSPEESKDNSKQKTEQETEQNSRQEPDQEQIVEPAPEPEPEPTSEPEPTHRLELESKTEDWEHKFKALQGVHHKEITEYRAQLQEYINQLDSSNERIEKLEKELKEIRTNSIPVKDIKNTGNSEFNLDPSEYLSSEEIEDWGEDMIGLASKLAYGIANRVVESRMKNLDSTLSEIDMLKKRAQLSDEEMFYMELARLVPDWEYINADENFKSWLDSPDGLSGRTRAQFAQEALAKLDAKALANYFDAYKSEIDAKNKQKTAATVRKPKLKEDNLNISPPESHNKDVNIYVDNAQTYISRNDLKLASEKYSKGEITWDEFNKVREGFISQLAASNS